MASIVSAGTTSATALNMSADTTGILQLASNNGTVGVTLSTAQNLMIGSTSDNGYKLKVVGGNASNLLIDNGGQQYTQLLFQRNGTANTGGDILFDGTASSMNIRGLLAGPMVFYTSASAGSPAEGMRIDTSQNATFAQAIKLSYSANAAYSADASLSNYASGNGVYLNGNAAGWLRLNNDGTNASYVQITGSSYSPANQIQFFTAGSQRGLMDASGTFIVGATGSTGNSERTYFFTSVAGYLSRFTNSHASNPYGIYELYSTVSPNNTGNEFIRFDDSTTTRFNVRSNGGISNYSANNVNLSDRREKTNFAPAKAYLDIVCNIPVQTFNYIDQNREQDDGLTLGVVAQDVQAIAPELVTESNWGTEQEPKMRLSIYQTDLQYALMKSIQELNAKVTALEEQVLNLGVK
jgi:hypothetical protein